MLVVLGELDAGDLADRHAAVLHRRLADAQPGALVELDGDLRPEGAAEADQQLGPVCDLLQAGDQQQAAGVGEDIGQSTGNLPSEWRFEAHRGAKRGAWQRRCNFEISAHLRSPRH